MHDFDLLLNREGLSFSDLYDVFNVRDDPAGLNTQELASIMALVLPEGARLTFKQLRYLKLVLDVNGDALISLEDFRNVFHGFASAGYVFLLRDEMRLEEALMRLAQRVRAGVSNKIRTVEGNVCLCLRRTPADVPVSAAAGQLHAIYLQTCYPVTPLWPR